MEKNVALHYENDFQNETKIMIKFDGETTAYNWLCQYVRFMKAASFQDCVIEKAIKEMADYLEDDCDLVDIIYAF